MAVVETLSVILQTLNAQFSKGMKDATKDTKNLERQVKHTQGVVRGFNASLKGFSLGGIGGKLGLPGTLGGLMGGFTFARFAKDSLQEHAKDNKELQTTLNELDESFVQIKKNFGAWMVEVAGAEGIIAGFSSQLKKLSGEDLNVVQGQVNVGMLDVSDSNDIRQNLAAIDARQKALAHQVADSRDMFGNPDPEQKRAFEIGEQERLTLLARLKKLQAEGLDTGFKPMPQGSAQNIINFFGKPLLELPKLLDEGAKRFTQFQSTVQDQLGKLGSAFQKVESDAVDFMAAFKITQGQMTPLEQFKEDTAELKRLFDAGFLKEDAFNLALLDARQGLEGFAGLNDPAPGRSGGARRGSAEAFDRVAAFQDRGNSPVQRSLDELVELAKRQLRLEEQNAAKVRQQFDSIETIDTKP